MTRIVPSTGASITKASRSCRVKRPAPARGRGASRAVTFAIGSAKRLALVPGSLHERADLVSGLLDGVLRRRETRERRVQVRAEDRLDRVPLIGPRPPVRDGVERFRERREVGVLLIQRDVVEDALPRGDAALV